MWHQRNHILHNSTEPGDERKSLEDKVLEELQTGNDKINHQDQHLFLLTRHSLTNESMLYLTQWLQSVNMESKRYETHNSSQPQITRYFRMTSKDRDQIDAGGDEQQKVK